MTPPGDARVARFENSPGGPVRVAIVGCGTQGAQIGFRCALHGMPVRLYDTDPAALVRASAGIEAWLASRVATGALAEREAFACRQRVDATGSLSACLDSAQLVIEAVPENLYLKREVWGEIDRLAPQTAALATNSSSLVSSSLASVTTRVGRTFSINFAFPAEDDLVEVMWHSQTSADTQAFARAFLAALGMVCVETRREIKGFSFNRVWRAIKKECLFLVDGGYCDFQDLDRAFMLEFRTKPGPFGIMDMIGLDVVRDIERSYFEDSGDRADLPPQSLVALVEAGRLGVKTGAGFYEYPDPAYEQPGWLHGAAGVPRTVAG